MCIVYRLLAPESGAEVRVDVAKDMHGKGGGAYKIFEWRI